MVATAVRGCPSEQTRRRRGRPARRKAASSLPVPGPPATVAGIAAASCQWRDATTGNAAHWPQPRASPAPARPTDSGPRGAPWHAPSTLARRGRGHHGRGTPPRGSLPHQTGMLCSALAAAAAAAAARGPARDAPPEKAPPRAPVGPTPTATGTHTVWTAPPNRIPPSRCMATPPPQPSPALTIRVGLRTRAARPTPRPPCGAREDWRPTRPPPRSPSPRVLSSAAAARRPPPLRPLPARARHVKCSPSIVYCGGR